MSAHPLDHEARAHQHRRVVSAWLTGDADPAHTVPDPSPRWLLAGVAAGVLTVAAWGAVGLVDQSPGAPHGGEPPPTAGPCR